MLGHSHQFFKMSFGYYLICPKCWRKYGRHFRWCIDCTPKVKPDKYGKYPNGTYYHRGYGWIGRYKQYLNHCCSKALPLENRLKICEKCKSRFKCFTEGNDD